MSGDISNQTQQDPKSIKQLEKELFKAHKESSVKIKKTIEDNKNIKIDIKSLNPEEYEQFKESFTKIQDKINLFDDLIGKLENIKPSKKWDTIKPSNVLLGKRTEPTDNRQNTNYQPGNNSTIQKHIDYLDYLKKILETKVTKDVKIMNLFNAVMNNTNGIINTINSIKEIKDKQKERDNKRLINRQKNKKKDKMKDEILQCSNKLKENFNVISNLSDIKYDKNILKKINKYILSSGLNNCNKQIAENLKNLIQTVKVIQEPESTKKKGGTNFQVTNDIIKDLGLININESEQEPKKEYTNKLKEIKDAYEKGLKQNIEDFKAICKALTEYLKNLQEIIKEFLTQFFENSKFFMEKKKEIYKKARDNIKILLDHKNIQLIKQKFTSHENKTKILNENISNLKEKISDLKEKISDLKEKISDLETKIKALDERINTQNTESDLLKDLQNYRDYREEAVKKLYTASNVLVNKKKIKNDLIEDFNKMQTELEPQIDKLREKYNYYDNVKIDDFINNNLTNSDYNSNSNYNSNSDYNSNSTPKNSTVNKIIYNIEEACRKELQDCRKELQELYINNDINININENYKFNETKNEMLE
jgi:trimeric autotransporter adhesin